MKRIITFISITFIIVFALFRCMGGDDDFVIPEKKTVPIDRALQHRIDSIVTNVPPVGDMALMVYDITARREIYTYREDELMRPASCLKLLTCITALQRFGASYTYKTRLYTSGDIRNDTLVGNIILRTQFDPALNRDSLNTIMSCLKQEGIKAIKGKVLLDVTFMEQMTHEEHWIIGDLKVANMGLQYKDFKRLKNETVAALRYAAGVNVVQDSVVFGRVNPHKDKQIYELTTPLHYAIEKALKNSSNINAEGLLYPLGYTIDKRGNYRANGKKVLTNFIRKELRLDPGKVCYIDDGCGLCPDNKVSARLLIELLKYAHQHKYIYNEVYTNLPLSGTDGTLYDRLRKPNVIGQIKAKTGTLTREGGISSLAGYFKGVDGHLIAFSIINNNCPVMDGRWWQDNLCSKAFLPKSNTKP